MDVIPRRKDCPRCEGTQAMVRRWVGDAQQGFKEVFRCEGNARCGYQEPTERQHLKDEGEV